MEGNHDSKSPTKKRKLNESTSEADQDERNGTESSAIKSKF